MKKIIFEFEEGDEKLEHFERGFAYHYLLKAIRQEAVNWRVSGESPMDNEKFYNQIMSLTAMNGSHLVEVDDF